jgi:hypothetical protein
MYSGEAVAVSVSHVKLIVSSPLLGQKPDCSAAIVKFCFETDKAASDGCVAKVPATVAALSYLQFTGAPKIVTT